MIKNDNELDFFSTIWSYFVSEPEYWFSNLSSISSIIGLGISVYLLIQVRKIRKSFIKKIRFPELESELNTYRTKLSNNISDWNSSKQSVIEVLSEIKGLLKNIKRRNDNKEIKECLLKVLNELEGKKNKVFSTKKLTNLSQDEVWDIYSDIVELQTILKQTIKDMKWEENE